MEFGFALVPVLAGYWFLTGTHLLKHPYESKTHHRVIFEPAIVGGVLLVISWSLATILAHVFTGDGTLGHVRVGLQKVAPLRLRR